MTPFSDILENPPAELRLLLSAVCFSGRPSPPDDFHDLAAAVRDWKAVLDLAARHHVTPLLYLGLKRNSWEGVPERVKASLGMLFAANLKRNFRLVQHACKLLRAFNTAGIPVIPYKGVFIAESVYGHLSSREVSDIDLLIDPVNVESARKILEAADFEPIETLDQQQVYRQQALQIEVDLHWQVSPAFFPVNYEFSKLWQRSSSAQFGEVRYRTLAADDLLILLCIQVAKDCWERRQRLVQLQKVCDISAVISSNSSLDWDQLRLSTERQGITRIFHFALTLAQGLAGARLPDSISDELASDSESLALARQVSALPALAETHVPPDGNSILDVRLRGRQFLFYLRLRELQRDRWMYPGLVLRTLLTPKRMAR